MSAVDVHAAKIQAESPAVRLGAGSGASAPTEWRLSAPELTTGPLIFGDLCAGRDSPVSGDAPSIAAETPQFGPAFSSHTLR